MWGHIARVLDYLGGPEIWQRNREAEKCKELRPVALCGAGDKTRIHDAKVLTLSRVLQAGTHC